VQDSPITSWAPSASYLHSIHLAARCTKMPGASHSCQMYQALRMSMLTGEHLRNDDNFKLTKYIRSADGSRTFTGMNTTLNEFGQVVSRVLLTGNSHEDLVEPLQMLAERYQKQGQVCVQDSHALANVHLRVWLHVVPTCCRSSQSYGVILFPTKKLRFGGDWLHSLQDLQIYWKTHCTASCAMEGLSKTMNIHCWVRIHEILFDYCSKQYIAPQ
jgi:hypothetical protein